MAQSRRFLLQLPLYVATYSLPGGISAADEHATEARVAAATRRGEQFAEIGEYGDAMKEYQEAIQANRNASLAHFRAAEIFFKQANYMAAENDFRQALDGDRQPKWIAVWSRIYLGKVFDITSQRERALNEYKQAERTGDNTQGALDEAAKYLKTPYER